MKKLSLNTQILIGALLGLVGGLAAGTLPHDGALYQNTLYISGLIGGIFINLLKMILIPLVFTSITIGIANLRAHAQMHKVWPAALVYYFCTTALAVILGLVIVNVFQPGVGLNVELIDNALNNQDAAFASMTLAEFVQNFIGNIFVNPFAAMADGNVLATVIFALFLGIALIFLGEQARTTLNVFEELFRIIMLMVQWIMRIAPVGIMALLIKLVATQDIAMLSSLARFIMIVLGATLFHGFVVLPLILLLIAKKNPLEFYAGVKEALVTALSTSSSSATLPITINCMENNLKADKNIAGFVLPLGATINMDGTALYEAVAAIFIANIAGIELNIVQQCVVFFTAIMASIGAPGIPSAGMVTMAMVLQSVGLPVEAIAILLPIDRLLDAVRTMVNVEGDCVGAMVVEKLTNPE